MIETFQARLPNGTLLSCRAAGRRGAPVLLFLHGFPEAAFVWDELLLHFADRYRCVAPNMRGFEQSSSPVEPEAYRIKLLIGDLDGLIGQLLAVSGESEALAPLQDDEALAPSRGGEALAPSQAGEALAPSRGGRLEALIAHDWGGAVAWSYAALRPQTMKRLVIINSPHPAVFLRELKTNPAQQAASAYMNFLIRPDAEQLLAADDFARLWPMFTNMGAADASHPGGGWLTDAVRDQYRAVWRAGLTGGCNYYRASPLRPPTAADSPVMAIEIARKDVTVTVPTLVLWAEADIALPKSLLDGLEAFVPSMRLVRLPGATHWVVHEQPAVIAAEIERELVRTWVLLR